MNIASEHRLRNHLGETRHLGAWVEAFSREAQLSPTVQAALDHALVECVTNVISYAFEDAQEHEVILRFRATDQEVRIEVEDDGREFDPRTVPPVDVTAPLETRGIGGLGVHMIRQLRDRVDYRRVEARNVLTLVKRRG